MHVELVETKKKAEERRLNRKPFVFKEIDFPNILGEKVKDKKSVAGNHNVNTFFHFISKIFFKNPMWTKN